MHSSQLHNKSDDPILEAPAPFLDSTANIPGWPGYRTRPGRSGLDYLDTYKEMAHMEGVIIRYLLTGKVFTRNPIFLFVMFFYGLIAVSPIILSIEAIIQGDITDILFSCFFIPYEIIGVAVLINVFISVKSWLR